MNFITIISVLLIAFVVEQCSSKICNKSFEEKLGKTIIKLVQHQNRDLLVERFLEILDTDVKNTEFEYLGCYQDYMTQRMFRGYTYNHSLEMTNKNCVETCKNNKFVYAGTQNGVWCHCGDSAPQVQYNAKLDDTSCNLKCSGDPTENCGGHGIMSVFRTGIDEYRFDGNKMINESSSYSPQKWIMEENCLNDIRFKQESTANSSSFSHKNMVTF